MKNDKIPMQTYLEEHLLQVWTRVHPGCHSITEEYKILQQSLLVTTTSKTYITWKHIHYSVFNCHLTWTTPPGLRPIMLQIPRKAESFSSLSRMLRNDVHLKGKDFNKLHTKNKISLTQ